MQASVLEFVRLLRQAGLRVATAETQDALAALALVDLTDRGVVHAALAATLVKRHADLPRFDAMFRTYFERQAADVTQALQAWQRAGGEASSMAHAAGETGQAGEAAAAPGALLARALGQGDAAAVAMALEQAAQVAGLGDIRSFLQVGAQTRRLLVALGAADLPETNPGRDVLQRLARDYVERNLLLQTLADRDRWREASLTHKSFYTYSEAECQQAHALVVAMARKIKGAWLLRHKRARRGRLDLKATIRRNLPHGGVPVHICFKKRRRERPDVVVLCDVSSSVEMAARFMLLFLHSLRQVLTRLRAFIFAAEVGEVTALLRRLDVEAAVAAVLKGGDVINPYAPSDYGRSLQQFWQQHAATVTSRTTVIILGDGRTNGQPPEVACLAAIQARARRVVWLNPERRQGWGFGDSAMRQYLPYIDLARECQTLAQLTEFVANALHDWG